MHKQIMNLMKIKKTINNDNIFNITMEAKFLATKGSLGNDSGNANENRKKKEFYISKITTLHVIDTFLTFLSRCCTTVA